MESFLVLLEKQHLGLSEVLVREFSRGASVNTLLKHLEGESLEY